MTWILHQQNPSGCIMIPMHKEPWQFPFPYLTSSTLPRKGKISTAGHVLFMLCGGIRLQQSPSSPRENEAKDKVTMLWVWAASKKKVSEKGGRINCDTWALISASAEVCAGTPHYTSDVPRGAMCTGNPVFQETGHIMVPPYYMQPLRGAVQKWWTPLSCAKLYVTSRLTTFSHLSNKFQSELVN